MQDPLDSDRLQSLGRAVLGRCDALARHSLDADRINRPSYSAPMQAVHRQVGEWMEAAGLEPRHDAVGNLIGRLPASSREARTFLLGSHLDTVIDAGRYDGVLGVMVGLAVAEALATVRLPFHLEVIGFCDEEGVRFAVPYLGSRAAIGRLARTELGIQDGEGTTLGEAMESAGFAPEEIDAAPYSAQSVLGYAEVHIEQGPVLDALRLPVGVVDAIVGQDRLRLRFVGEAGHAGTVPVDRRRDPSLAAAGLILAANACAQRTEGLRATTGRIAFEPNVRNVIPGAAVLDVDLRHPDDEVREGAVKEILEAARSLAREGELELVIEQHDLEAAVRLDEGLRRRLEVAVETSGQQVHVLTSGAGHDAVSLSQIAAAAMLFVRSPRGISHHPDEAVEADDVRIAIEVMVRFLLDLP